MVREEKPVQWSVVLRDRLGLRQITDTMHGWKPNLHWARGAAIAPSQTPAEERLGVNLPKHQVLLNVKQLLIYGSV